MIKNIIFDVGNVLAAFRWRDHMRDLGYTEDEIEELREGWIQNPIWDELDRGVLSTEEALRLAIDKMPHLEDKIRGFWNHPDGIVRKLDYAVPWVRSYKERGFGVYILSNYPEDFLKAHKKEFEFMPYTDGAVFSCFEKLIKPDVRIYQRLLSRYELSAGECIFTDDRPENVGAAKEAGIYAVLFKDHGQAKADIEKIIAAQALVAGSGQEE